MLSTILFPGLRAASKRGTLCPLCHSCSSLVLRSKREDILHTSQMCCRITIRGTLAVVARQPQSLQLCPHTQSSCVEHDGRNAPNPRAQWAKNHKIIPRRVQDGVASKCCRPTTTKVDPLLPLVWGKVLKAAAALRETASSVAGAHPNAMGRGPT